tara:strand:- start:5097 stop:7106 length:2010 start_codon:yes stop_codon:yes gene_type:complete
MSNAFTNAWGWSIKHSPLLSVWRAARGFVRPNREAFALLEKATLPESIDEVIRSTIVRTKLWRDERAQIARELIAHAQDALDAGQDPQQVADTFGDPRRVARLLRRSMKRKRPLSWQAYRFSRRAVGAFLVMLLLSYSVLAVRFYTSSPEIKVDFAALLDERNQGYREDQKSWPVISEVGLEWSLIRDKLDSNQEARLSEFESSAHEPGIRVFPNVPIDHPDFASIADAVRAFDSQLVRVREAAARPIVGIPVGYETRVVQRAGREWTSDIIPADANHYKQHSVIEILLPNLGWTRGLAQVLMFDAKLALSEGEAQRAADDYIAALGLARQCRSEPFVISKLVGVAINSMVMNETEKLLREHPGALSEEQLIDIAHEHARVSKVTGVGLDTQRVMFADLLQRLYTDDGHGDGHMTPDGMAYMGMLMGSPDSLGESLLTDAVMTDPKLRTAAMPLSLVATLSREQDTRIFNQFIDRAQRVLELGPPWIASIDRDEIDRVQDFDDQGLFRISASAVMLPELTRMLDRHFRHQQRSQAFGTMLAIEVFKLEHGRLPDSLEELTPRYLPEVPQDLMNPHDTMKLRAFDNGYMLYSVGSDGDDDGGRDISDESRIRFTPLEQSFRVRYRQAHHPTTHDPLFEPDGSPVIAEPRGPDGDWILIDTRPAADHPGAS